MTEEQPVLVLVVLHNYSSSIPGSVGLALQRTVNPDDKFNVRTTTTIRDQPYAAGPEVVFVRQIDDSTTNEHLDQLLRHMGAAPFYVYTWTKGGGGNPQLWRIIRAVGGIKRQLICDI